MKTVVKRFLILGDSNWKIRLAMVIPNILPSITRTAAHTSVLRRDPLNSSSRIRSLKPLNPIISIRGFKGE
jgi:hypothetical protein